MRGRRFTAAGLGAAVGLAVAIAASSMPASAVPRGRGEAAAAYTCATFEGLVLTQSSVNYSGVSLRAGEAITARVSPAATGDEIMLSVTLGLSFGFHSAPASQGLTYKAPGDGTYNFGWWLRAAGATPPSITWTFDCSTSSGGTAPVADSDRDGVSDAADACAGTILPDAVRRPAAGSYYADRTGRFVDGAGRAAGVTVVDAGGCSAAQIAKAVGLSAKDSKSGIPLSVLTSWAASH